MVKIKQQTPIIYHNHPMQLHTKYQKKTPKQKLKNKKLIIKQ